MNDLIEKFKAMDTSQKLLVVGVVVCILTLPFYFLSDDKEVDENDFDSLETPENRKSVEDYNSKLEAYEAEESEDNVSLDFNLEDFKDDDNSENIEEELMEKEIDSLLNENKREYTSSNNRKSSSSPRRSSVSSSPVRSNRESKEEISSEFNEFFTSSPKSKKPKNDTAAKTDPFIYAVIHGDHTIKQGERVKLRLTKKALIAGMDFPQNSYVYAFPTFQNNRVLLNINSINHVPVSISAYDTEDSAIGLYVKGAKMVGEIADESSKDAVDDVDVGGVPVGSTIKKVFQKKQEQPSVTLLNNTKLILKPDHK